MLDASRRVSMDASSSSGIQSQSKNARTLRRQSGSKGVALDEWQIIAASKREERDAQLLSGYRLTKHHLVGVEGSSDVRQVPVTSQLLSSRQIEITEENDAAKLAEHIAARRYTALEVTEAYCARATIAQDLTNCLTEVMFTSALQRAQELDDFYTETGRLKGPLHGLPISLKDQFNIKGVDSSLGYVSGCFKPATANSILVDILLEQGAVLHCKTNVPQTLMSVESNNNVFGRTLNPCNRELTSGGSSGGEGALVAMKGSIIGVGTDFGGSIRAPSNYCGLYGLRNTMRRMPYTNVANVMKGAEQIESVIGPLARSYSSIDLFMQAIMDSEPWLQDSRVIERPWVSPAHASYTRPTHLRVGIIYSNGITHNQPPIDAALRLTERKLRARGHEVIPFPAFRHAEAQSLFGKLASADGGTDLASFTASSAEPTVPEAFSFMSSKPISVYDLYQLVKERNDFRQAFLRHWRSTHCSGGSAVDLIICPCAPHLAPQHLGKPHDAELINYTTIWSLLDLPACTLPLKSASEACSWESESIENPPEPFSAYDKQFMSTFDAAHHRNAPVVLQLVSPMRFQEDRLISMACEVEECLQI